MTGLIIGLVIAVVAIVTSIIRHRRVSAQLEDLAGQLDADRIHATSSFSRSIVRIKGAVERAEASTRSANETAVLLQRALDRLPEGVVITDAAGHDVVVNAAARAMAGTHHGDAIVLDVVESLGDSARGGETRERTIELVGPPRRTVVIRAVPFDTPDGDGRGALVVVEDVTERQRLEDVRTDFVANVSHELKTPVGALALLAETMAVDDDPEVVQRLADKMLQEAHRVGDIITDLLELSRIEIGDVPVRGSVLVRRVFTEAIDRVRDLAGQRNIRIERTDPSARLSIAGDRRQLVSAVGNLLENAVKYSDDNSVIELVATAHGGTLDIVVRDHGIGIPARDINRVFERFYRVDRARSRGTGGTGLGLAIVRHVAENHGGNVMVESMEGEGSTFTLRLPVAAAGPPLEIAEAG